MEGKDDSLCVGFCVVGVVEGTKVGDLEGLSVVKDGKADGSCVVGTIDGVLVGCLESVGRLDGNSVGDAVGVTELVMVGVKDGCSDGSCVVGTIDGVLVG